MLEAPQPRVVVAEAVGMHTDGLGEYPHVVVDALDDDVEVPLQALLDLAQLAR